MFNDLFISFRNDPQGQGKAIGRKIKSLLEENNYSVYFNPDEQKSDTFTEELSKAILNCKDFVLIITNDCLEQLLDITNVKDNVLLQEVVLAHKSKKHIVPVLIDGVNLPDTKEMWPEDVQFLYDWNYISFPADPDRFSFPPISFLKSRMISLPEKGDRFRNTYNSNQKYNVFSDFKSISDLASSGDEKALYELSIIYYYGITDKNGTSARDYDKAYDCFLKLSKTENPYRDFAVNMIGHMYYTGTIPREGQSYEKSLKHHIEAAETISAAAQHVAYMLSIGSGCEFDYKKAVTYFENIAKQSDNSVKFNLAQFFMIMEILSALLKYCSNCIRCIPQLPFS